MGDAAMTNTGKRKTHLAGAATAVAAITMATMITSATPASAALITSKQFFIGECTGFKNTNLVLRDRDKVVITATGSIWAGVWFTGRNGPAGWNWAGGDKFPSPADRPYSLVGELDGEHFTIGTGTTRTILNKSAPGPSEGELHLHINDDAPCNGDGAFTVTVNVFR